MYKLQIILTSLVATLSVLVALLAIKQIPELSFGGATPGLYSTVASSSETRVGSTSADTIFTTTDGCTSRVISTTGRAIMLSFGSTTPTAVVGHVQSASTTVAYDSEIYGCGQVRAYAYEAGAATPSSTIGLIEYR